MRIVKGFTTHSGKIAVYDADNVDTDRIIPARFLTMVTKSGYGELLFKDVRGPSFPLDQEAATGATVLVVGSNFGCGSSREHAVWAIQQAGFRCVVSKRSRDLPGYSDIFRQNAANCGLLLIELPEDEHSNLVAQGSGSEISINLPEQTVSYDSTTVHFEISPSSKDSIIKGLDLIGSTLSFESQIAEFERSSTTFVPKSA